MTYDFTNLKKSELANGCKQTKITRFSDETDR